MWAVEVVVIYPLVCCASEPACLLAARLWSSTYTLWGRGGAYGSYGSRWSGRPFTSFEGFATFTAQNQSLHSHMRIMILRDRSSLWVHSETSYEHHIIADADC